MFKNYFKIAFRNFLRYKGYTSLNILGLAIGISASLLILQYVSHELSYDTFHEHKENVYRVEYDFYKDGEVMFKCASAFPGVGPSMKNDFPEVEAYTRLYLHYGGGVIRYGDKQIKEDNIFNAEPSLFDVFSFELVEGDRENALVNPNTALIAEDMVEKYFPDENPIGKRITYGSDQEFEITGIIRSPENSHLKFSFLFSMVTMHQWGDDMAETLATNFGWYDFYNYIRLTPGSDPAQLEAKLPAFIDKYTREGRSERTKFVLQPLSEIHLYSNLIQEARVNGNGTIAYVLLTIALFILGIAWVNYINLATARAMERAREVGIRKVIGAQRFQLIRQFIFESVLLNAIAAVIAIVIYELTYKYFNVLAGKDLDYNILATQYAWLMLLGLFFIGAFLSGLYPAFVLSSYKPIAVLKGRLTTSFKGAALRRGLVLGQFWLSAILIAGTLVVYQQISFMQNQDLGMNIEQTLIVNGPGLIRNDSLYQQVFNVFKQDILADPNVISVAASTEIPGNLVYWTNGARKLGAPPEESGIMYRVGIDYDYIDGYEHEILAGRGFERSYGTDENGLVITEATMKMLGFSDPETAIAQKVVTGGDTMSVIGVISNYHQEGLQKLHDPISFLLRPNSRSYYSIKLNTEDVNQTISFLQEKYQTIFPENPFNYFFLDSFYAKQYQSEVRFGKVFGLFSFLAILVACLGLLGLSAFSANQRSKEISIRKVLGSSTTGIFYLLSKEYIRLIIIANLIAIPVVWFGMNKWLETFAFSITVSLWVFLVACLATFAVAFMAVSYQSIKAAHTNPINALRNE